MPVAKNQIIPLTIESLSSDGSGVGHYDGQAIFVPSSAPGDQLDVKIVKDCGRYAFGILQGIRIPSPARQETDCPCAGPCGGCCFRHLKYSAELEAKQGFVADAFRRIGGLEVPVLPILPSPQEDRYRNKVQYPVGVDKNGHLCVGFYAGRSHRIIPCGDCRLQPSVLNEIAEFLCRRLERYGVTAYDEASGKGLLRHIFLRQGAHSGEILVCLVCNGASIPHGEQAAQELAAAYPAVRTVVLNENARRTNVILGGVNHTLYGPGYIQDTLCGVPVQLGPLSFYQVNTPGAEQLYGVAARYAALRPGDRLLDLYCGMGTIGLSMAKECAELIGVEVVDEAIRSARQNAARMGAEIAAKSRFFCADAGQAAARLAAEGLRPDVIVLDPPRKGCDAATLDAVLQMEPQRIVMVSCNPATAARDVKYLDRNGYRTQQVQPVDLFPRTKHVETVVLLSRETNPLTVEVKMEVETGEVKEHPTYKRIQEYVQEKYGFKVHTAYIAEVKRMVGLDMHKAPNAVEQRKHEYHPCPPEKVDAIKDALRHFGLISE